MEPLVDPLGATHASGPGSGRAPHLPRGTEIGRYILLETLGEGGMGVVYAAYDTKLDRRVALKAMHATGDPERESVGRGRLVREARAMAKLSHPNVLTVYDVVAVGDDQMFVAMELVLGRSLRDWLAETPRGWREVLDVFLQAGRGLSAAHEAGIVHRDFKPDNVLVGDDGRVRVADFGLARSQSPEVAVAASPKASVSPLASSVTNAGTILGTPLYMAPDQLEGAPSDARSDQFSFCAALHEGLYGEPPFEGGSLVSLSIAMREQRLRPPPRDRAVPGWLRAVVVRGLRADAHERFASMREVLAALEANPTRRRVRGAVVAVALGATATVVALSAHRERVAAQACVAAEHRVSSVWNGTARAALRDALGKTGRPYAALTFERVATALDAYAAAWSELAASACRQARTASPGDDRVAWRADCLDSRLGDARALLDVLAQPNGESVDRAIQAVQRLPTIASCAEFDPRSRPWPTEPAVRLAVQALSGPMSEAEALDAAGRYTDAAALAARNEAEASRIGFAPVHAETLLTLAQALEGTGDRKKASSTYHAASLAAESAGAPAVAARAWMNMARLLSEDAEYARADLAFDHAAAWADRAGDDELRARILLTRGARLSDEGRYDEARQLHETALHILERLGSELATTALDELGIDADRSSRYDEAADYYQRALARTEAVYGPDHVLVAVSLSNLGLMEQDQGKVDQAIPKLERALRIRENALGPTHYLVADTLFNLAGAYVTVGRNAEAAALARRAMPLIEANEGPDAPSMAFALSALGDALVNLGQAEEALPLLEHALAIRQRAGSPLPLADGRADLGVALVAVRRDALRARELLLAARDGYVAERHPVRLPEVDAALARLGERPASRP